MSKDDFKKIALAIKTTFPNSQILQNSDAMDIWYMMLGDIDYRVCQAAVLELISISKFPPTIAEIREKCSGLTSIPIKDWGEAWESVIKAIGKYGYYETEKALESMDELTRMCVRRIGFQNICMSENVAADRANFRMIYETEANRKKVNNQLPPQLLSEKQKMMNELIERTTKQIGLNGE
ncbi:hypothetical protein HNQ56_003765 [Anaerotaenia torta]|uniref:replicative helicase loader/inhibitor n=1 Tax=Anaerotaenia torta TaxID=433293 RepID=UPI003D24CEF7